MNELLFIEYYDHFSDRNKNKKPFSEKEILKRLDSPIILYSFGKKLFENHLYIIIYDFHNNENHFILKNAIIQIKKYKEDVR